MPREITWMAYLCVEYDSWGFNLRPSNTELLVRLNLESGDPNTMEEKKKEVLKVIKESDTQ